MQTTNSSGTVGFVARLNATGDALLYSSYFKDTTPNAVAVDPLGHAYVAGKAVGGMTTTTGAYQTSVSGSSAAFISEFSPDGTTLVYSTYLGGTAFQTNAEAWGIALDTTGDAYVTGDAARYMSVGFPTTTGAYQTTMSGGSDAFVSKLNATGTALSYSTFLGGTNDEHGYAITVDRSNNAYVTGQTTSTNFPTTTGAYQTTLNGGTSNAFVTKLNSSGSALVYSTYLGDGGDRGNGIDADRRPGHPHAGIHL